jgi:pimeloyl-ACP methyl ester carboxylesterase
MARILYLHGSSAGPFGLKTEYLERHGHLIVGRPRLPYPRHPRRSWRWLVAYFAQAWFRDAAQAAQESFDACRPDVVVGSSMGGAVAMNIVSGQTPQLLVAPAWRAWCLLRFGQARRVKVATVVVHGDRDRTVFPRYSRRLLANSRPARADAVLVAAVERRLRERLGGQDPYRVEGRLVLIRGEGHRCNSDAALLALLAGVEVLAGTSAGKEA